MGCFLKEDAARGEEGATWCSKVFNFACAFVELTIANFKTDQMRRCPGHMLSISYPRLIHVVLV